MIIWVSGAFGIRKMTTADLLCWAEPGSVLFDPEGIGGVMRRSFPEGATYRSGGSGCAVSDGMSAGWPL